MIDEGTAGNLLTIAMVVGLIALPLIGLATAATSDELREYVERSQDWCDDRDGELVNVQAVLHGGLHCDLPNGTSIHMTEVEVRG